MTQEMSQYSTDLFQLIAENARDFAIFVTDLDGRVASWNPGVESLLGYAEREWVGRHASAIFTPEDRVRSLRAGFQHHVTKPAEPQELVAVVANLAGRSRGE
jgi:PAS domain S-box-containing protein